MNAERNKLEEWISLIRARQLRWPEDEITEAEETRQRMSEDRVTWEERVHKAENWNFEKIKRLLKVENIRRIDMKPADPDAHENVRDYQSRSA